MRVSLTIGLCAIFFSGFAQLDTVSSLKPFEDLQFEDTLVVDIRNVGCFTATGHRYLIYREDSVHHMLKFKNFCQPRLAGSELLSNSEKQLLYLREDTMITRTQLSGREYLDFIKGIEIALERESLRTSFSGDYCFVDLCMSQFIYKKSVEGRLIPFDQISRLVHIVESKYH